MAELDQEMEMDVDVITLLDMNNNDVDFYHVATIDYEDKWYVFLQPVKPIDGIGEDEVIIYELGLDDEGDDKFIPIENDELLDKIFQEYVSQSESDEESGDDCGCDDGGCGDGGCGCGDGGSKEEKKSSCGGNCGCGDKK